MPLSAAAIQTELEGHLTTAGWTMNPATNQILTAAIAATIFNQLTTIAKVNGGVCTSGGPISGGVIS